MQKAKSLNPALLGRPIQTLDALAAKLAARIAQQLQEAGHRSVAIHIHSPSWQPVQPLLCGDEQPLHIDLARQTVQALMATRYGFAPNAEDIAVANAPASATELRIGEQLQKSIAQAVAQQLPASHSPKRALTYSWQWQGRIRIAELPEESIQLTLGNTLSRQLEASIQRTGRHATPPATQAAAMTVDLNAVLLEKTFTAADIQTLQPGSVLPITLQRTVVTLNGQAMLSASVAEHQGKLHLTAFENLD